MPSLLLQADDPQWTPAKLQPFVEALCEIGLLTVHAEDVVTGNYRPDDEFLSLVMFLGCSPQESRSTWRAPGPETASGRGPFG